MALYEEMQQVVGEILGDPEFKQGATFLIKMVAGAGPVDDPGPSTPVRHSVDGAVRGAKFRYVSSGLAVATDLQITFAVVPGVVPAMSDFVEVDGVQYKIKGIDPKPSAGDVVAYVVIFGK